MQEYRMMPVDILSSRIVFNCLDAELSRDELTKVESLESL